jgi:hypothetical protein
VVTARSLVKVAGVLVGVVVLRLVAGVWITAAVLAGLAVVGLVAGWAAVERRAFPRRPQRQASVAVAPRGRDVAFARALAVVAAAFVAESERDERQEMGDDGGG